MTRFFVLVLGLALGVSVFAQDLSAEQSAASLNYFNGQIVADLTWLKPPAVSQKNQLKIDLALADGQPFELDPSDLSASLFMTDMPDMGTSQQAIVSIADASGNPIAGSYIINGMKLSMGGSWTLLLALPNPDGSGKYETQIFQFTAR